MRPSTLLPLTLAAALAPAAAAAQTVLFSENWESGSARWRVVDANPIVIRRDADACSSQYLRETVLLGGGRVFLRNSIPVTAGRSYCLGAWIRGSTGTQPFMGFYLSDAMGNTPGTHYWFIGVAGYGTGYSPGDLVAPVTSDGRWRWVAKTIPINAGITHVVPMIEIFSAGSPGDADFDDIHFIEGECPATPPGVAARTACSGATPVCAPDGRCVACLTDAQCTAPTSRCDATRNACVACLSAADCGGATPVCEATMRRCVGCRGDSDCGGATPVCLPSGACGECTATRPERCMGMTPVCDDAMGRCRGCRADPDCGDARSGRVCDVMTGACGAGCSRAAGRNGCPEGQFCTSDEATRVGVCTTGCALDADCASMADRTRCLARDGGMNVCVGCRGDSDCAGRMDGRTLCEPDRNQCVACTAATRMDRCSATGAGSACLADGACGCATDSDCGDARSGRVCGASTMRCEPGCRPGGNGCPDGMTCVTEMGATTGRCETPPPPDAGGDAAADVADDVTGDVTGDVTDDADADGCDDATTDSGAQDAGTDAGAQDVATVDAATDAGGEDVAMDDVAGDLGAPDAGTTSGASDGCGCRAGAPRSGLAPLAFVALALASSRRRRRRA